MPGCTDEVLEKLENNVNLTPYVTQLLEIGYTPQKMIEILGRGLDVDIKETIPLSFKCPAAVSAFWRLWAALM